MTLKEELEILRGEPINVFDGDPMEIPCIETSDSGKLCKHPVVSVHMITYNHEPYIRQAIEGVMMQKTDFEFELVIGEDCSQDKTREICFEYQKLYPDKIRVLWWHENVSTLGGNGRRVRARCRGEYIAFCEGDDYWTDPLKLQKQVEVMRKHPNVGLCFCGSKMCYQETGRMERWNSGTFPRGEMEGKTFFELHLLGGKRCRQEGKEDFIQTATVLIRMSVYAETLKKYKDLFSFNLFLGDSTIWLGISSLANAYYLEDVVSVYRINAGGVTIRRRDGVMRDAGLVRLYYLMYLRWEEPEYRTWFAKLVIPLILSTQCRLNKSIQLENYKALIQEPYFKWLSSARQSKFVMTRWGRGRLSPRVAWFWIRVLYFREDTIRRFYRWVKSKLRGACKG